ncbi:hypothetical protein LCGC14_3094370 [marine sediment metagenome]|uniref:Uncharacterized protein n=1 Tax=marine sediment metagenome TaxID=412755 RepID=A0A0F8YH38_9ZZZZ
MADATYRSHAGPDAKVTLRLSLDEARAVAGLLAWTPSWEWMEKLHRDRVEPREERERIVEAAQYDREASPGVWGPLRDAVRSADGREPWER